MKIRLGFVSNSSTASFLIATKQELTQDLLEQYLKTLFRNGPFAKKAMNLLWDGINYDILYECKPYELDFYEITLDQGEFQYYPGSIADEGLRYQGWFDPYLGNDQYKGISMAPEDMYGLLINDGDFKLCIGYLKKRVIRRTHVRVKDKVYIMDGIQLYLKNNDIEDIKEVLDIDKIPNLMIIDLSNNRISNLKGFENLKKLKKLNLSENKIKEISELESHSLELLDLSNNQIEVINEIGNLSKLKEFYLNNNQIIKIKNLQSDSIKKLNLSNNKIGDIEQIKSLSLESLDLSHNNIKEIKGLNYLPNLKILYLRNNPIDSITNLENLRKLEILNISSINIKEILGLDDLNNLKAFYCNSNQITKIKGLDQLVNLERLECYDVPIKEISGLGTLKKLKFLNFSSTGISEIKGLDNLVNLQVLELSNTEISEIKGLENLKSLRFLNLEKTNIPKTLIDHLGGTQWSTVKEPQKFVEYCKSKKK